ncbi:MAG: hypothetical protein H6709_20670 [Kofleriaceae bacterium]|nr:hypothetical protein [Kofleriaceae bacterium]MCB9574497.1 hypothetical protein [Kofleriaceae bacterium]
MTAPPAALPFELTFRGGEWRGRWAEEKVRIAVGGAETAPAGALVATLHDVVTRWAEVKQTIAAYTRGLAPDHHVPLDRAHHGGFAARSCGFDGDHVFESIAVTHDDAPRRVVATFYTGYPDGYATFAVVLDDGTPTSISAFAS